LSSDERKEGKERKRLEIHDELEDVEGER